MFKLHAPLNYIVGGGVFLRAMNLPCSYAWETLGTANGAKSLAQLRQRIIRYRRGDPGDKTDFHIGCRILTQPFFLPEDDWLPIPQSWSKNIVSFKRYDVRDQEGAALWAAAQQHVATEQRSGVAEADRARYGGPVLITPRLGQAAFRALVTDIYQRRCAVTGERTLPALEAAHIRPYADGGLHVASNGLLMRRDIHSLFDVGYVTVTPEFRFEVSRKIKEEFENGRDYYRLHGNQVEVPKASTDAPDPLALGWHNTNRYMG